MHKKNKIVVYTAIFGGYEDLIPQPEYENFDYVCFTDADLKAEPWQVRKVEKPWEDSTRNARFYKILAHKHLKEYETSIYIDGNFLLLRNPVTLVKKVIHKNSSLAYFDHNLGDDSRNCVYEEHAAIVKIGEQTGKFKDDPAIMSDLISLLKEEGYPKNNGLISSGVLIRNHNDKEVVKLMEDWWHMVKTYSKRDQLSFNFVQWKNNFTRFTLLEGDIRKGNKWFYFLGHHKSNFAVKLQKFKIKRWWRRLFRIEDQYY